MSKKFKLLRFKKEARLKEVIYGLLKDGRKLTGKKNESRGFFYRVLTK